MLFLNISENMQKHQSVLILKILIVCYFILILINFEDKFSLIFDSYIN
jgi:hypothetical protein